MRHPLRALLLLGAALLCLNLLDLTSAQAKSVYVITVHGEIDAGQTAMVHRAYLDAAANHPDAVLLEVDTFGGLVDAAVAIRDTIIDAPMETICYVKNRAWSAGALIALSHRHIVIAPGGSIGAAEPIPTTEKTIAALKAEFAATANKTGRDPRVAEAMVDKTLGLPNYAAPGQILALTDYQALQVGYAESIAPDRTAVLEKYGLADAQVVEYSLDWTDRAAAWFSNPLVESALLSIMFLAVLTEIKTAGIGVAALFGSVAALLFFGSQWLTGVAGWLEVLLFAVGLILLAIELYVPGFGVFGFAGICALLFSLFLTLGGNLPALNILAGSIVIAGLIFAVIVRRLPSSRLWAKLALHNAETTKAGFTAGDNFQQYLGQMGIALTMLRPAGTIEVNGIHLDVVTEGSYVAPGTKVRIISVAGSRIVVREVKSE